MFESAFCVINQTFFFNVTNEKQSYEKILSEDELLKSGMKIILSDNY